MCNNAPFSEVKNKHTALFLFVRHEHNREGAHFSLNALKINTYVIIAELYEDLRNNAKPLLGHNISRNIARTSMEVAGIV